MSDIARCVLTTKDFTILEVMLDRMPAGDDIVRTMLRKKLSDAVVMLRDDIPADIATLSSRVAYRVGNRPAETRIIAHGELRGLVGLTIPITTARGLALLGMSEGQSVPVQRPDGRVEAVTLERVIYQPEAARRNGSPAGPAPMRTETRSAPMLRLVHGHMETAAPVPARPLASPVPDRDDPGPSAA